MKNVIQIFIFIIILISIYFFYTTYFKEKKIDKVFLEKSEVVVVPINTEIKNKETNLIQNLEYEVNFDDKNYYKIQSISSEINYEDNFELIKMYDVKGVYIDETNSLYLTITSDTAIYSNKNYKTNFKKNVKIIYLDSIISGENLILDFEKNKIIMSHDIKYQNKHGIMFADVLNINLISKKIDIFMENSSKEVTVNLKKQ
jgi:hypothetical protein